MSVATARKRLESAVKHLDGDPTDLTPEAKRGLAEFMHHSTLDMELSLRVVEVGLELRRGMMQMRTTQADELSARAAADQAEAAYAAFVTALIEFEAAP